MPKTLMPYPVIVGQILVSERSRQGVSQRELASAIGISQPTLSKIENGLSQINLTQLARAATCLGTSPSRLLSQADRIQRELESEGIKVDPQAPHEIPAGWKILGAAALTAIIVGILTRE